MRSRIVQFFRGILANPPDHKEQNMINDLLPPNAQQAFYSMTTADQRHTLNVLADARRIAAASHFDGDMDLLGRCCLLHDIGRGPQMDSFKKSYAVLFDKIFPRWARQNGQAPSHNPLKEMLYRYYQHPKISHDILKEIGMEQEARIVLQHHSGDEGSLSAEEARILAILMQADEIN